MGRPQRPQPSIPPTESTAGVTSSLALDVIGAIWIDFSMPISIGPIIESPPSSRSSLAEMLADWRPSASAARASVNARRRRSEEHTSELQSLMRISYAVFCLKKKKHNKHKE